MIYRNPAVLVFALAVIIASGRAQNEAAALAGRTRERTYSNSSLGIAYTTPNGMAVTIPALEPGHSYPNPLLLLSARSDDGDRQPRLSMVLMADHLNARPHTETPAAYVQKLASMVIGENEKLLHPPHEEVIGRHRFERADFRETIGRGQLYKSDFVIFRKGYALGFVLMGRTPTDVERLAASLKTFKYWGE